MRPTFLIIGAQKCGTTWLHQHLNQHPDVYMPAQKELEFFSYQSHLIDPGVERYLLNFSDAGQLSAIGEASASYFWTNSQTRWSALPEGFQRDIPKTVQQNLGDKLKLIVTLRNPVERVISAYLHYLAMGEIDPHTKFNEAMNYGGIVDMGFYARHLLNWMQYYPLEQIKILIMETDIQARPLATLADVCDFLHIAEHTYDDTAVRQTVYSGTERIQNAEGVFIKADDSWQKVISAKCLQQLNKEFQNDVKDLDAILGTQLLHHWKMAS